MPPKYPQVRVSVNLNGSGANIFTICSKVRIAMRQAGLSILDCEELYQQVVDAENYSSALAVIGSTIYLHTYRTSTYNTRGDR